MPDCISEHVAVGRSIKGASPAPRPVRRSGFRVVRLACVLTVFSAPFVCAAECVTGAEYEIKDDCLTVVSGAGALTGQTPATITEICVSNGATLKIDVDNPFANPCEMRVFGTLDVNGRSFEIARFYNCSGNSETLWNGYGRVVNTASAAATITIAGKDSGTMFRGTFEELPGRIDVVVNDSLFWVRSPVGGNHLSSLTLNKTGGRLYSLDGPQYVKFVFYPADESQPVHLGEIGLTFGGKPVHVNDAKATSTASGSSVHNLYDEMANTFWKAAQTGSQTITLSTGRYTAIDGYRITPYDGASQDTANRPSGWDVYVLRGNDLSWTLVDSKRDFQWYPYQTTTSSTNIPFSSDTRIGTPFGTKTAITLNGGDTGVYRLSGNAKATVGDLSGKGQVQIEDGSVLAPGDLSSFTGVFTAGNNGYAGETSVIELSSRGGAEQLLSITNAANIAVVNGGAEPVSVLLDDSRKGHLFGKLSDGADGRLGLVKRGIGERMIETEDASYTGPTAVHAGTLTVVRRRNGVTARYIRIVPLERQGTDDYGYPWGANEFMIFDQNGAAVNWPQGTKVTKPDGTAAELGSAALASLIDGDTATRMLMPKYSTGSGLPPVVIDTVSGVTFSSYSWWTPAHSNERKARVLTKWRVEISNDGESWAVYDAGAEAVSGTWVNTLAEQRGPYSMDTESHTAKSGLYTLGEEMFADGTERDTHRKIKARYFRLHVYETMAPVEDATSYGWQLSEIGLMKDGLRVDWPDDTVGELSGAVTLGGTSLSALYNNRLSDPNDEPNKPAKERTFIRTMPSYVTIDAKRPLEFDAYSFTSSGPAASQNNRLPVAWKLMVSQDGEKYYEIDTVSAFEPDRNVISKPYQELGPFPVAGKWPLLDLGAGNSIGDESPVVIGQNATLKLSTDYEKFGPLSGMGTLELAFGATGEINVCDDASFSGSVTGGGTLVVGGSATQTFDGASLSGVSGLELNGGVIAGSASFGGADVSVSFDGGATGAALSDIGKLSVTGNVKYAQPDIAGISSYKATLFSAESINQESKNILAAGQFTETAPISWKWNVDVSDTKVVLRGYKIGLRIFIR